MLRIDTATGDVGTIGPNIEESFGVSETKMVGCATGADGKIYMSPAFNSEGKTRRMLCVDPATQDVSFLDAAVESFARLFPRWSVLGVCHNQYVLQKDAAVH